MDFPAWASATLVYGIWVDAYSLLWASRVWDENKGAWHLLAACTAGRIECAAPRTNITHLPRETISLIETHLWEGTRQEAECDSWLLFGVDGLSTYHPTYCCQKLLATEEMPAIVQEAFRSGWDQFRDHFSYSIPRCSRPCGAHPVCRVVHSFLRSWNLTLAECAFQIALPADSVREPTECLIASIDPTLPADDNPLFRYHLALDTDGISNEFVRETVIIQPDWQDREKERRPALVSFLAKSRVTQPAGALSEPQFYLVCAGQNNE